MLTLWCWVHWVLSAVLITWLKYSSSRQSTQGSETSMGRTSLEMSQHLIRTIFIWNENATHCIKAVLAPNVIQKEQPERNPETTKQWLRVILGVWQIARIGFAVISGLHSVPGVIYIWCLNCPMTEGNFCGCGKLRASDWLFLSGLHVVPGVAFGAWTLFC